MEKNKRLKKILEGVIFICLTWASIKLVIRIAVVIMLNMGIRNGIISIIKPFELFSKYTKYEHYTTMLCTAIYMIFFSSWLFKKYKNAHSVSRFKLTYKPIWALFSLIIPIFNLVAPYQIMNEIWAVNNKDLIIEKSNRNIIKIWWFLGIAIFIYAKALNTWQSKHVTLENYLYTEYHSLLLCAFSIHYYYLIRKILSFFED